MTVFPTVVVKSRKPATVSVTKLLVSIFAPSELETGGGVSKVADAETHSEWSRTRTMIWGGNQHVAQKC